jgi:6-pyruvoyltetrahydropterin/6-carboxytetrahydropterin synthase
MGYRVKVTLYFSAAHRLRGYKGKCENLHGHNWKVEACIGSDKVMPDGMLVDFKRAKGMLKKVLSEFDHTQINNLPYFKKHNPTSENVAKYIFDAYKKKVKAPLALVSVSVWEAEGSQAEYYE